MPAPQLRAVEAAERGTVSDPRSQLREQIARVAGAQDAVKHAQDARDRVHGQLLAAMRSLDTARDKLREAESDNQANRVAVLLGEAETGPALSELKRATELAETVVAGVKSDEAILDAEIRRRRQTLDFATIARDGAVADVLRPAANSLLRRIQEAAATAAALRGALRAFPLDCLPAYWDSAQTHPEDAALNAHWRDTVAALATDPDHKIPETE